MEIEEVIGLYMQLSYEEKKAVMDRIFEIKNRDETSETPCTE